MLSKRLLVLAEEFAGLALELEAHGARDEAGVAPLLDTDAAAEILSVSSSTVRELVAMGQIPYISLSPPGAKRRIVRFDAQELRAWWLERQEGGR